MEKSKVTAKVITLQSRPPSRPHSPSKVKPPHPPSSTLAEPTFRPRAKVSSSVITSIGRTSSSSSAENSTVKSTARAPSTFKRTHGHARKLSSTRSAVDIQVSRPKASLVPHELSRQRSLTSTLEASFTGRRRNSTHPTPPATPTLRLSPDNPSTSPPIRVKAKVSSVAKSNGFSASPTPAPPGSSHPSPLPFATIRPVESRPRTPSIADLRGFGSRPPSPTPTPSTVPATVYPITMSSPAANPHRYAPRVSPSTASARFQSLSPPTSHDPGNGVHSRSSAKVDPAAIPLPPQSPPTSTLSFSSQSSRDTSVSGSTAPTPNSHAHNTIFIIGGAAHGPDQTFDVSDSPCDPNSPRHSLGSPAANTDSDRKIRAEAKTNRKIEDLEITNRSLLAINSSLETTRHKQAAEIRELRRKLRESRLMLPPQTYRAIKSSLGPEDMADDEDVDEDDEDNNDDGDEHDETYGRIKGMLEDLLETGRRALRTEPRDFGKQGSGVKVLSAEEVRTWRGDIGDDLSSVHSAPTDAETDDEHHLQRNDPTSSQAKDIKISPSKDDDERTVEMGDDKHNAGSLPPITVTFS